MNHLEVISTLHEIERGNVNFLRNAPYFSQVLYMHNDEIEGVHVQVYTEVLEYTGRCKHTFVMTDGIDIFVTEDLFEATDALILQ